MNRLVERDLAVRGTVDGKVIFSPGFVRARRVGGSKPRRSEQGRGSFAPTSFESARSPTHRYFSPGFVRARRVGGSKPRRSEQGRGLFAPTPFEPARSPTHRSSESPRGLASEETPKRRGEWRVGLHARLSDLRLKGSWIGDDTRALTHPPLRQLPIRLGGEGGLDSGERSTAGASRIFGGARRFRASTHPPYVPNQPDADCRGGTKTGGIVGMFSAAFSSPRLTSIAA